MNNQNDTLESMIADETAYHGPQTQLWAAALEKEQGTSLQVERKAGVRRGIPMARTLALAATVCLSVGVVGIIFSSLTTARSSYRSVTSSMLAERSEMPESAAFRASPSSPADKGFMSTDSAASPAASAAAPLVAEPAVQERHVIRKATMDLLSPDVRGAYAKIGQLINEGAGEFIEGASFSGEGESASAQLTLRVTAQRMGEVMMKLGSLAKVTSQQTFGEDVTNQVVDIQARLRNEQRVETELLELLSARRDAPLKEVLELREQISRVREQIERLTAQRETLGRLTSLASIAITIHADAQPKPTSQSSRWDMFGKDLSVAWGRGMDSLSRSLVGLVEIAVSGFLVWVVLAVTVIGLRYAWVAASRNAAAEPAPRF
ncbi:MAG: DUF4349 domain-containing protein [Planctomycetota bacterium]|nr:DUF4349 domain-containing protein [Planctomycetota bacterium]